MPTHTRQSVFNQVYLGLQSQGFEKSVQQDGFCMYRGLESRKCAVGHLIPDAEYQSLFDSNEDGSSYSINGLLEAGLGGPTLQAIVADVGLGFLADLQSCHDSEDLEYRMQERLEDFAATRELTVPQ